MVDAASSHEHDAILAAGVALAKQIASASWAAYLVRERRSDDLIVAECSAPFEDRKGVKFAVREFAGVSSWVALNKQPKLVKDIVNDSRWRSWNYPVVPGMRSILCVPAFVDSRLVSLLAVEAEEPNRFRKSLVAPMSALANLLASFINEFKHRSSLLDVARKVISGSDIDSVLSIALGTLFEETGALSASIRILNQATKKLEVHARKGEKLARSVEPIPFNTGINGLAFKKRTYVIVDDVALWSDVYLAFNPRTNSELAAPIFLPSDTVSLGTINLEHSEKAHFDTKDAQFVAEMASVLAYAIMHEREQQEWLRKEQLNTAAAMAVSLAHPINSFLKVIDTNLRFIESKFGPDDTNAKRALGIIQSSVDQTARRAAAILSQARAAILQWVDLGETLGAAVQNVDRWRPSYVNCPVVYIPDSLPKVWMDKEQLLVMFENIITNSYEAIENDPSKPSHGQIVVAAELKDDGIVSVVFQDDGPGFEQSIMEGYLKNPATTKAREKHMGVGLYLSKRILQALGGDLDIVNTDLGRGAKVILSLPCKIIEEEG